MISSIIDKNTNEQIKNNNFFQAFQYKKCKTNFTKRMDSRTFKGCLAADTD